MSLIVPDAYDKLFCRCDNIAAPNTFLDSALTPKAITANGNATQLPIKFNKSAGFFNGTTDYVVVPDSADWDFGTGDFNVTVYVNFTTLGAANYTFLARDANFQFYLNNSAHTLIGIFNATGGNSASWTPVINTWYKIEWKRVSGSMTMAVDDSVLDTDADSQNVSSAAPLYIGAYPTPSNYFGGWMKNLSITKAGTPVLTMNFDTPATSPLGPAIAFDGTGDYLSVPNGGDFDVGTGDFTIDWEQMWGTGFPDAFATIFDSGIATSKGIRISTYPNSGGNIAVALNGSAVLTVTPYALTPARWNAFRLERTGGNIALYMNGKQIGSTANSTNITANSAVAAYIGANDGGTAPFLGFMREIRFSNVGRDGGAYTPSQSGFTVDANTKLYIKGNENNGVTTFLDSSTSPKTVTTNGDAKIKYTEDYRSCIFKDETGKFPYPQGSAKVDFFAIGSGVGYFDGTGDYLSVPDSADWNLATDSFTLEFYLRPKVAFTSHRFLGQYADASNLWKFGYDNDYGMFNFSTDGGGGNTFSWVSDGWAFTTEPVNGWMHVSLVRDGTSFTVYVNGTSLGTKTGQAGSIGNMAGQLEIGRVASQEVNGLLDNIRISKGVARYTATFNPPEDFVDPISNQKSAFFALL